jgi:hypothetical protein
VSRARDLLIALTLVSAGLTFQFWRHYDPHIRYDRFTLPGYDAHAYAAMAEEPAVFTVAPWGYRILTPWLVHSLPLGGLALRFACVTYGSLALAGVLLFDFCLRLGLPRGAAWLCAIAFTLTRPVAEAVAYRFLVEPLTILLMLAWLLAVERGAPLLRLALIATIGILSKEFFLLLLPLVYLARRDRDGDRRALATTLLLALPMLATFAAWRLYWTPQIATPAPKVGLDLFALALFRVSDTWSLWWRYLLLDGLMPLALLGAWHPSGRVLLRRYGLLLLLVLVPPFFNPVAFFPMDIPRLLLYALPLLLPLAWLGIECAWRRGRVALDAAQAQAVREPLGRRAAVAIIAATLSGLAPLMWVDRYLRADLSVPRDGPYVLATCRESLRVARRLDRGYKVVFTAQDYRFAWGRSEAPELNRMRWFLRDGWGAQAQYGIHDIIMRGASATLLVPTLGSRDLEARLTFLAAETTDLAVSINDRRLVTLAVTAGAGEQRILLPRESLQRGDNLLRLTRLSGPAIGPRLQALALQVASSPSPSH